MKSDDISVLREVQKNTEMAQKALQTISEYVHDEQLSRELFHQNKKYEELKNRAMERLYDHHKEPCHESAVSLAMVGSSIRMNTLLDTSTSHIAELLIKGNNTGVTDMWKTLNHHDTATNVSLEIAKELTDFEEECRTSLRRYL